MGGHGMAEEKRTLRDFFDNRTVASVICVIAVLLSIWLGGGRGLINERNAVEDIYYNGVNKDGVSIQKDITVRFQAAGKLAVLAEKYSVDAAELIKMEKKYESAAGISANAEANEGLDSAVYAVYNGLMNNSQISEADKKSAQSLYNEINSRGNMIKNDGYNAEAQRFNSETLGAFPANIIAMVRGVKKLELFR